MPPKGWEQAGADVEAAAKLLAKLGKDKGKYINILIAEVRNGKPEKLGVAIATLKAGIGLEGVPLAQVMEGDDIIPVLTLGMESDKVSDQLNSGWILCEILEQGTPAQREKVMVGEGTAIYPILLKRLASSEEKVRDIALKTIGWMFHKERFRDQLWDPAILPVITELVKKTDDPSQLFNADKVAYSFCHGPNRPFYPHSLDTVRKVVDFYAILGKKRKDGLMTQSLSLLMHVEGSESAIVSSGVLQLLVERLSHSSSDIRLLAMQVISSVAKTGPQMLEFFNALKGAKGMEGFYKFSQNSKVVDPYLGLGLMDFKGMLVQFFQTLNNAMNVGDAVFKRQLSDAVLDAGFVVPLVKCVEDKETSEPISSLVLAILKALEKNGDPASVSKAKINQVLSQLSSTGRDELPMKSFQNLALSDE